MRILLKGLSGQLYSWGWSPASFGSVVPLPHFSVSKRSRAREKLAWAQQRQMLVASRQGCTVYASFGVNLNLTYLISSKNCICNSRRDQKVRKRTELLPTVSWLVEITHHLAASSLSCNEWAWVQFVHRGTCAEVFGGLEHPSEVPRWLVATYPLSQDWAWIQHSIIPAALNMNPRGAFEFILIPIKNPAIALAK